MKDKITVNIQNEVEIIKKGDFKSRVFVLFHGFRQNASWIFKNLESVISEKDSVLAFNGPFIVPRRNQRKMTKAYAWYFYNSETNEYIISNETAINVCRQVIDNFAQECSELIFIGFSQGGYLAPYMGKIYSQTSKVIMLSARFRSEDIKEKLSFPIYQIHGTEDLIIPLQRSKECFEKMIQLGNTGKFYEIQGSEHTIDAAIREKVSELIN